MFKNVEQTLFTHTIGAQPTTVNITNQTKSNVNNRSTVGIRNGPSMMTKGNVARGNGASA